MNQSLSQLECPLEPDSQFFFLHIPKTAGTSLIRITEHEFDEGEIARWLYPFRLVDKADSFFKQHRYFHGHVEYSVMRSFLSQPPVTVTMLREPVARYLSHFSNHKRVSFYQVPDVRFDVFTEFQQTSLADFVHNPPQILIPLGHYFQNLQARMLASEFQVNPGPPREELRQLIETGFILPPPTVEQAQERLGRLAFVGVSELFQESLFLLAYTFGWLPVVDYQSLNVSPRPLSEDRLSPDLLDEINNSNWLDQQVYEYGKALFEKRYEQMNHELLERYGRREHAGLKLPLSNQVMVELLDEHYRRRCVERYPTASTIRFEFDRNIPGRNWHVVERDGAYRALRWSGPGRCSTIHLTVAATSDIWLRFSVAMSITQAVLDTLVIKVNGVQILVDRHRLENGDTIYQGYVLQSLLQRFPGSMWVSFEVDETVKPVAVLPGNQDERLVGIAVTWVEVEPARPVLEECNRLKALLGACEAESAGFQTQLAAAEPEVPSS